MPRSDYVVSMRADIEEVLGLQVDWTWRNTPEMQRRGVVVRTDMARWLRGELPALSRIVPPTVDDLSVEGRDGTGRKTRVPWVRVFSKMRSPSATEGFYIVYLFNAAGDQAYLSLNQGTRAPRGGSMASSGLGRSLNYASA